MCIVNTLYVYASKKKKMCIDELKGQTMKIHCEI